MYPELVLPYPLGPRNFMPCQSSELSKRIDQLWRSSF
jgi:hypothetical protein